jgi:hypothetical protein
VPTYISSQLVDPSNGTTGASYNANYGVIQDSVTGRVTVVATGVITTLLTVTR